MIGVNPCLVFDFENPDSDCKIRLSVFASVESDIHRAAVIKAVHEESGLEWICQNPVKFVDSNKKQWIGYSKFLSAEGERIPSGKYHFYYEDLSGRETELAFNLTPADSYFSAKVSDFPDVIKQSKSKKIALFDEKNSLIYYGEFRKAWKSNDDIRKDYADAIKFRICYATSDNKNSFLMPFEFFEAKE